MKREIVTLCGSTKFREAFEQANFKLTCDGCIVLSVGCFMHADSVEITPEQKVNLDRLHFDKIRMSDCVLVLNVGGYIGESTRNELAFAMYLGIRVDFIEPNAGEKYLVDNAHAIGALVANYPALSSVGW